MTLLLTTMAFGIIIGAMAIGLFLGGRPLSGSCGGKGGPECVCDAFEQQKCAARNRMLAGRR